MEASGVVLRQIPCVSGSVTDGRYSGLRFSGSMRTTVGFQTRRFRGIVCSNEFADKGHMSYYSGTTRCGGEGKDKVKVMEKEKKKEMKKKAKVLKALSKNLNMFSSIGFGLDPEAGLVAEIQNKTISEATEILVKQLDQLKAEEKLLKKQRKEEKAKAKAMKMMTEMDSESSSSSESSDSDCDKGKVVTYESGQLFEDIKKIKEYISVELFSEILELEPDKLEILKVENMIIKEKRVTDATIEIIYARLIKHRTIPDETNKKDWSYYYGPVKNQGPRDICWAIVAVELVTTIRWIKNRGKGIEYSYKELVEAPGSSRPALRGPMYKDSVFRGMHAVSVTGSGVENGESFLWVRSSHGTDLGQDGYFRVSIDVMILRTSKCQDHEERYFKKPTPLLERFCYPDFPRF